MRTGKLTNEIWQELLAATTRQTVSNVVMSRWDIRKGGLHEHDGIYYRDDEGDQTAIVRSDEGTLTLFINESVSVI